MSFENLDSYAEELVLYADNTSELYPKKKMIQANLKKKKSFAVRSRGTSSFRRTCGRAPQRSSRRTSRTAASRSAPSYQPDPPLGM